MKDKDKKLDDTYINPPDNLNEFDFVEAYDDQSEVINDLLFPENSVSCAINCGFIGIGGGGGKLVKAFLDLGFNKSLLVNTTEKDQPIGIPPEHFLLIPGADGVGKDISLGKTVLGDHSALLEDALRTKMGKIDWIFVIAGGGGGTGSASHVLDATINRYLKSVEAKGKVVYIVSKPTAQELLNPTVNDNYVSLISDVKNHPHIIIDNEKQLQLLRGKIGMLNMYPAANKTFAKLLSQIFKLANERSPIQSFDSKDLEKCFSTNGRILVGSTIARNANISDLGSKLYQGCLSASPCPGPSRNISTGVLILITTSEMASDAEISNKMEAAFSYVGGRTKTMFSGVYIKEGIPGLVALTLLGGMD